MKFFLSVYLFVILACTALAGCSDNGGSGGDGDSDTETNVTPNTPIPFELMCETFVDDACNAIFECAVLNEFFEYRNQEDCRADLPCRGLSDLEKSVENEWVSYNPDAMGACHARLRDDPCGSAEHLEGWSLQAVLLLCGDVIDSHQKEGEPCLAFGDCQDGLYCAISTQCPGTCVPYLSEGSTCDDEDPTQQCDWRENLECLNNVCLPEAQEGESCAEVWCDSPFFCADELDFAAEPICMAPLAKGAVCMSGSQCEGELTCRPKSATATTSTCLDPAKLGMSCDGDADCEDPLVCVNDACADPPVQGEACTAYWFTNEDSCAVGFTCEEQVCVTSLYLGDTCGGGEGACVESTCVDHICAARLPDGSACGDSNECHSRNCQDDVCRDPELCENRIIQ